MSRNLIILPVYNRGSAINGIVTRIMDSLGDQTDLVVVDDGSDDSTAKKVKTSERVFCIAHEESLGYGAALINGLQLAKDMGYDYAIAIDAMNPKSHYAFSPILRELAAGNSVVSCSRMTKEERGLDGEYSVVDTGSLVSSRINDVTGFSLIDPFSPYKGFSVRGIEPLQIEEYDENAVIQLWVQSAHHGLPVKEIVCDDIHTGYISEEEFLDRDQDYYLSFIDAEKILYPVERAD